MNDTTSIAPSRNAAPLRPQSRFLELVQKTVVSLFIVLNLAAIAVANLPDDFHAANYARLRQRISPQALYRVQLGEWMIRWYAHKVGLDNRWQMFSHQSAFNWRYVISGKYGMDEDAEMVVLPLPLQSERTFFEYNFVDFKEQKFYLNIYRDVIARRSFSQQLCRAYPNHNDRPISAVVFELETQGIYRPEEARRLGTHLHPDTRRHVLDTFPCPCADEAAK